MRQMIISNYVVDRACGDRISDDEKIIESGVAGRSTRNSVKEFRERTARIYIRQRLNTSASVDTNDATGDKFNPGAALLFFESGSALALALPESVELGGGGVLELDGVAVAVSPAPPLPPAVRGTSVG